MARVDTLTTPHNDYSNNIAARRRLHPPPGLGVTMRRHRNPRASVSAQPTPDNRRTALPPPPEPKPDELDHLLYALRDNLRRADAFITTAESQIEESWSAKVDEDCEEEQDEDCDVQRRRMRVEYLVEGGKGALRAALYTVDQIDNVIIAQRRRA